MVVAGVLHRALSAAAEDYPYPGVFTCYEHLFIQDEKGDFTTYVLDGLQWLRDRKLVYLVLSTGHCDFFPRVGIEQCSIDDASDGAKSEAFTRLGAWGPFGIDERIYPSEQALLTDRGVDAIRVKCGSVDMIKLFLTTDKVQKGSCHELGNEGEECYYEPSANPTYNDMVSPELRKIRDLIQKK